ncbi:MAG: hypothetical protein M5U12_19090 [Verrucomicrobia bacterium]|nr:hypothetical protein [Verrucomicrobiota bacterium]
MTTDHVKVPGKKRRDCPALQTFISAADCGRQRGSQLACPAHCPHFPFGTAAPPETWTRLELEWVTKALRFLSDRLGRDALQARLRQCEPPVQDQVTKVEGAVLQLVMMHLMVERDAEGRPRGRGLGGGGLSRPEQRRTGDDGSPAPRPGHRGRGGAAPGCALLSGP